MRIETTGSKPKNIQRLIFLMLDVLHELGIPMDGMTDRRKERMAETCLAVAGIKKSFAEATSEGHFLRTRDIIVFMNENYGENISLGSYDDIRRKDLLLPVQSGIVINSSALDEQATNNPMRGYSVSPAFAALLHAYGTSPWQDEVEKYKKEIHNLQEELARKRELEKIPVLLPSGASLSLSAGEHNVLQKRIAEDFLPRFGMGAQVLYIGDTSDKLLFMDKERLQSLGFFALEHDELPDVVAYSEKKNLLFLIEAVHSAGPMSEIRVAKLKSKLERCTADCVFVTAFMGKKDFRRWVMDIAWETEVWIADAPDHLVHFNGYKFLEMHK